MTAIYDKKTRYHRRSKSQSDSLVYSACLVISRLVSETNQHQAESKTREAEAQAGVAQEVSSTCHTAEAARLLTARFRPVAMRGGVAGVAVAFRPDHVFPIADLFELHQPDIRLRPGAIPPMHRRASSGRCCGYRRAERRR